VLVLEVAALEGYQLVLSKYMLRAIPIVDNILNMHYFRYYSQYLIEEINFQ